MNIPDLIKSGEAQMIADRRYLHEHPELAGEETGTLAYIEKALKSVEIETHRVGHGGLIGVLNGDMPGPCVLLRADVDALPIEESETNLRAVRTCRSKRPGVMHACGHDAHVAMQLGAARALAAMREQVPACVLFVFEQGEEKGGFIDHLLPYIDSHYDVGVCYATHVRWDIPAGRMALCEGPALAGAFGFDVTIRGRGGHGSRPDLACSPIDCFCAIHQQLSALRMRVVEPDAVLTYSLGMVQAGEKSNVIPDRLRFAGTVRTYDTAGAGERFAAGMKETIAHSCAIYGCEYELTRFTHPLYETNNFPPVARRARRVWAEALGEDAVCPCRPWMASETMSAYLRLWPGVMSFTGIANEAAGCGANHHTPEFDLDESALAVGAAAACAFALDYAVHRPVYDFRRDIVSMEDLVSRSI